jgi:hypothetical protein
MSLATHQHFVPQFLLRRFGSGKKHHVHVFDKRTLKSWRAPVERVAAERGYYNVPDSIKQRFVEHLRLQGDEQLASVAKGATLSLEQALGRVESAAAKVVERVVRDESVAGLTLDDRTVLALFVVVQKSRSPIIRDLLNQTAAAVREHATVVLKAHGREPVEAHGLDSPFGWTDDDTAYTHLKVLEDAVKHLPHVAAKDLLLHRAPPGHVFMIGDSPVTLWNHGPRGRNPYRGIGLATAGTEIALPISPRLSVVFICPSLSEMAEAHIQGASGPRARGGRLLAEENGELRAYLGHVKDGIPINLEPQHVEHLNARQVEGASRFLYASDGHFTLAKEMLSADEALRRAPRFVGW